MGGCCCGGGGGAAADAAYSREVDLAWKREQQEKSQINKLLLLGAGESGKSTLFKQMHLIYGTGRAEGKDWKEELDLQEYVNIIHNNIVLSMKTLCEWSDILRQEHPIVHGTSVNPKLARNKQYILDMKEDTFIDMPVAQNFDALWRDQGIQQTYANRSRFQLTDSTAYYLDKVLHIGRPGWLPDEQDFLRARVRTTGIVEEDFLIEGSQFKLFDVGGQRNERKKWIHCFSDVRAVLFVAALSAYDLKLFEDDETNRMDESLDLWHEICNSRWFKKTSMILMLNKKDLFEEKIQKVPLTVWRPEYTGRNDYESGANYIKQEFEMRQKDRSKTLFAHFTCATDSTLMKKIFRSTRTIIIEENMKSIGLLQGQGGEWD
jgi:GTPase SAR1 family protein